MFAYLIRQLLGLQARWLGCAPEPRPRIYFANHTSNLDGPAIWASLPRALRVRTRPVAAKDYWLGGPVRRFFAIKCLNAVLIERKKVTADTNPMIDMGAALAAGSSLIIFPEGLRVQDEDADLNPFKPGLWHLAKRHPEVELIPVWLEDLNRILPRGEALWVPVMGAVTFGAAIALAEGEDKNAFLARARQAVSDLGADA
jgi:1-acyl-sn-glycerol-3-phosphate acyltransferase